MRRMIVTLTALGSMLLVTVGLASTASARADELTELRAATARFASIGQAAKAGYGPFYICTEQPGVGTMGQHYVNGDLVGDPAVDLARPEALVYAPTANGGWRLVALEYVVIEATLDGAPAPTVLGQPMTKVVAGNRYGLPDFYQRHVWLYDSNPLGLLADWNPTVSCRGTGDDGG